MSETATVGTSAEALPGDLVQRLVAICGADAVRTDEAERTAHAGDCWPLLVMRRRAGAAGRLPDVVACPEQTAQVQAIVRLCAERGVAVVPYGGGSGVCGGTVPVRGGVSLDLKRMAAVRELREDALLCEVEAGVNGMHLEEMLNQRGYTLGHFPSSIMCSTVGGWIAARSSGQASTRYGSIEHLLAGLEVVLPSGEVAVMRPVPRTAAAVDWRQVFCGSEGTLGVITRAWLRLQPLPEARARR
jgi:alkyldihydroxyacetonephosphate synthase